jgi:cardiolipin synthase (CMP-forming)
MRKVLIPLNIPNILSLYRLFSFPFLFLFIILGYEKLFAYLLWFNLTTDVLDGWIARKFNLSSEIGARIDALADTGTYILALTGILLLKWEDFEPFAFSLFAFCGLFLVSRIYPLLKFRRFYGYHTIIAKTTGYIHGIFFIVLFVFRFISWFYYAVLISGLMAFTETILLTFYLDSSVSSVRSLFHLIRSRNNRTLK